jgi:hypothetical protein
MMMCQANVLVTVKRLQILQLWQLSQADVEPFDIYRRRSLPDKYVTLR